MQIDQITELNQEKNISQKQCPLEFASSSFSREGFVYSPIAKVDSLDRVFVGPAGAEKLKSRCEQECGTICGRTQKLITMLLCMSGQN